MAKVKKGNIGAKVKRAVTMIPNSPALTSMLPISQDNWVGILAGLNEDDIDDLLLLLEEEKGMLLDVDKTAERKMLANQTRYMQRLERLRITMESLIDNTD